MPVLGYNFEMGFNLQRAMPVETVLPSNFYCAPDVRLPWEWQLINNMLVIGHLQVNRTDVFLCLTTAIRTIISFPIKSKGILLYLLSIYMYCNKMPVNIETAKELED